MNLTHHFLVSMPHQQEGCFHDSLVYILDHSDKGAFGVIVNRDMGMTLQEVFSQLSISTTDDKIGETTVLHGGPVEEGHGLVLHRPGHKFDITRDFDGGVSVSSSKDILEAIALRTFTTDHLIILGHSGWASGQLEMEVIENAWLTTEASPDILFDTPQSDRRNRVCENIGVDLDKLVGHSGNA